MKRLLQLSFSVVLLCHLAGCIFAPVKPEIEIRYKNVPVVPADYLIVDCDDATPPDLAAYQAAKQWTDKEAILVGKIGEGNDAIAACNIRMKNLRKWKQDQLLLLQPPDASASKPK
jgi:hypothetical protein